MHGAPPRVPAWSGADRNRPWGSRPGPCPGAPRLHRPPPTVCAVVCANERLSSCLLGGPPPPRLPPARLPPDQCGPVTRGQLLVCPGVMHAACAGPAGSGASGGPRRAVLQGEALAACLCSCIRAWSQCLCPGPGLRPAPHPHPAPCVFMDVGACAGGACSPRWDDLDPKLTSRCFWPQAVARVRRHGQAAWRPGRPAPSCRACLMSVTSSSYLPGHLWSAMAGQLSVDAGSMGPHCANRVWPPSTRAHIPAYSWPHMFRGSPWVGSGRWGGEQDPCFLLQTLLMALQPQVQTPPNCLVTWRACGHGSVPHPEQMAGDLPHAFASVLGLQGPPSTLQAHQPCGCLVPGQVRAGWGRGVGEWLQALSLHSCGRSVSTSWPPLAEAPGRWSQARPGNAASCGLVLEGSSGRLSSGLFVLCGAAGASLGPQLHWWGEGEALTSYGPWTSWCPPLGLEQRTEVPMVPGSTVLSPRLPI